MKSCNRGRTPKRPQADLYTTILEVIKNHPEGSKITKMSYGVAVPVDRLKIMVEALCSYGLVMWITEEHETFFDVTPRGSEFLETYWKMKASSLHSIKIVRRIYPVQG